MVAIADGGTSGNRDHRSELPWAARSEADGVELFRLSCYMAALGNRVLIVNRWTSRGESTALLLKGYLNQADQMAASEAWRRSILELWETPLYYSSEPVLGTLKKDFPLEAIPGEHPIFWSGPMILGDSRPR